jgi:hypothetical protein
MASFIVGIIVGGYTGAMIREEYYFPTIEKIERAFKIYKENEKAIEELEIKAKTTSSEKPKS